jgi:hypothetical protein
MNELTTYTYTILRYVHDTTTGEFINVGVALYAPQARYASALCRNTYGRLNRMFPGINAEYFKSVMRHIQSRFEEVGAQLGSQLPFESPHSVEEIARRVLPADDSSLQWSPVGSGRTDDPASTLESLYDRMVNRYEDKSSRERRTEEDVWRHFKRRLESHQLLQYFEPHTIAVKDDEIQFQHTWQNSVLHCLEPVSFDLASAESIRDKAHRWLGRITSIAGAHEKFRMYFMVGEPHEHGLESAFDSALSILGKTPVPTSIFREQQVEEMTAQIMAEVAGRERPNSI